MTGKHKTVYKGSHVYAETDEAGAPLAEPANGRSIDPDDANAFVLAFAVETLALRKELKDAQKENASLLARLVEQRRELDERDTP